MGADEGAIRRVQSPELHRLESIYVRALPVRVDEIRRNVVPPSGWSGDDLVGTALQALDLLQQYFGRVRTACRNTGRRFRVHRPTPFALALDVLIWQAQLESGSESTASTPWVKSVMAFQSAALELTVALEMIGAVLHDRVERGGIRRDLIRGLVCDDGPAYDRVVHWLRKTKEVNGRLHPDDELPGPGSYGGVRSEVEKDGTIGLTIATSIKDAFVRIDAAAAHANLSSIGVAPVALELLNEALRLAAPATPRIGERPIRAAGITAKILGNLPAYLPEAVQRRLVDEIRRAKATKRGRREDRIELVLGKREVDGGGDSQRPILADLASAAHVLTIDRIHRNMDMAAVIATYPRLHEILRVAAANGGADDIAGLAKAAGVSRPTVYNVIHEARARAHRGDEA